VIDAEGHRSFVHADKRAIIHNNGLRVPIRDMRLLDHQLGASDSTLLVRDNAIIVSLEHVRVIVAADRAILPREGADHSPLAARFVDVLEEAVGEWARQRRELERLEGGGGGGGGGAPSDQDDTSSGAPRPAAALAPSRLCCPTRRSPAPPSPLPPPRVRSQRRRRGSASSL
jgi:hypothetical protein